MLFIFKYSLIVKNISKEIAILFGEKYKLENLVSAIFLY